MSHLTLSIWYEPELVTMLQHALRAGDCLDWSCNTVSADRRRLLHDLQLDELNIYAAASGDETESTFDTDAPGGRAFRCRW